MNLNKPSEQFQVVVDVLEEALDIYKLIVFNDDVNTFDHVIETLMDVCKHDFIQAEQCTLLIHYKGKCIVKEGSYEELRPMCEAILERSISAQIQE